MIWSPAHGDTAFMVPLFDQFMKRIMPGNAWRSRAGSPHSAGQCRPAPSPDASTRIRASPR